MRRLLLIVLLCALAQSAQAAPGVRDACKFGAIERAFVRVYGGVNVERDGALVEAWLAALRPTSSRANFGGLPRVATVTLFRDGAFAGMLMVHGEGETLRLWARNQDKAMDWQPCAAGELPAAVVDEWIRPMGQE